MRAAWHPLGVLGGLVLLVAACRILPAWPVVFPHPGEVRFFEADPWYHVRQTQATVAHYPHLSRWDRGTHYPTGERGLNQSLFDFSMATVAEAVGLGHPSPHVVDLVAAWTPVVLSMFLVVLVYAAARLYVGPWRAVLASGLLVLLPGYLASYSLLGYADHHIAEDCLAVWTCLGLMRGLSAPTQPWWRPAFSDALPLALFLYTWSGAGLHLGLAAVAMAAVGVAAWRRGDALPWGYPLRYVLALAVLYYPLAWLYPDAVLFPAASPVLALEMVGLAAGVSLLWAALRSPVRGRALLCLGGLVIGAALVCTSGAGRWGLHMLLDRRSTLVAEQQPTSAAEMVRLYGVESAWALVALPLLAWKVQRGRLPLCAWVPATWAAAETCLWLHTYVFNYAPPPFLALLAVAATPTLPTVVAGLVGVQAVLWGCGWTQTPWLQAAPVHDLMLMNDDWSEAMAWLRQHTPALPPLASLGSFEGDPYPYPPGCYGVFCGWDDGEYIAGPGGRLALWSEDLTADPYRWLLLSDEDRAHAGLRAWAAPGQDVRYLVVDARMAVDYLGPEVEVVGDHLSRYVTRGPAAVVSGVRKRLVVTGPRYTRTMLSRLYWGDANGLGHFRLVHETPGQVLAAWQVRPVSGGWLEAPASFALTEHPELRALAGEPGTFDTSVGTLYDGRTAATVKIFESVPGALLTGTTAAGQPVSYALDLRDRLTGRSWTYQGASTGDSTGHFAVRVAWPTDVTGLGDVSPVGAYRIESAGRTATVTVPPDAVQRGAEVDVVWR